MSGFLDRWSQRKRAALRGEDTAPESEAPTAATPEAVALPVAAVPVEQPPAFVPPGIAASAATPEATRPLEAESEEAFDPTSLPPLESLHAGSDFAAFLRKGVPLALRHAALRKAWVADPLIRDYRSPLDYGWDFNTPGGLPAGFSDTLGETAEKVKELLRRAIGEPEPEADAPDARAAEEGAETAEEGDAPVPVAEPEPPLLGAEAPAPAPAMEETLLEDERTPRRRHGGALPG